MKLTVAQSLQSPESTPTSTSGGSAPERAPDVGDKLSNEEVVDDKVDWASAGEPDDFPSDEVPPNEDTSTGEEVVKTPPSKTPQKQPAQKPAVAKPAVGEEPVVKQPGEEVEEVEETPAKPPAKAEETPVETPEQKVERERLHKEAMEKDFSDLKEYYAVPEDYAERLRTEPELVMPELAAKVHQAVFQGMQKYMTQAIPQFLQQHTQYQEANTKAKEAFFGRWPSLAGHEDQVLKMGAMFSQINPKATPQQKLEQVGKMVCVALGIDPDLAPTGEEVAKPPLKAKALPKKKVAMKPANPSGSSNAAPPSADNPFGVLAEEFLAEDRGE